MCPMFNALCVQCSMFNVQCPIKFIKSLTSVTPHTESGQKEEMRLFQHFLFLVLPLLSIIQIWMIIKEIINYVKRNVVASEHNCCEEFCTWMKLGAGYKEERIGGGVSAIYSYCLIQRRPARPSQGFFLKDWKLLLLQLFWERENLVTKKSKHSMQNLVRKQKTVGKSTSIHRSTVPGHSGPGHKRPGASGILFGNQSQDPRI